MNRRLIGMIVAFALLAGVVLWRRCGTSGETPATAPRGSAAAVDPIAARRAAHEHPAEAAASSPASISGTVTRKADGAPVAGAVVSLVTSVASTEMSSSDDEGIPTLALTDAQGAWTATPLAAGTYAIAATAPAVLPATLTGVTLAAGEHRTGVALVVEDGAATVHGVVTDVGGGPVAGARLTAHRSGSFSFAATPQLVTLAGADGSYGLPLPDGKWEVTATHDDYTRVRKDVVLTGKPRQLDFSLVPGASIRGEVVSRDGKPVAGAIVAASASGKGMRGFGSGGATTDATGAFTLHSLHSGSVSLTASGRGFASAAPTVVDVGIGESVDGVRLVVDRAFGISGYVVRKGKPAEGIAGVRVAVFSLGAMQAATSREPSGADGYFEVVGVRPASYLLFALGEDVVPEIGKSVEVVDHDVKDVIVEMATGVTLSGQVQPPGVASFSLEPESIGLGNMFDAAKALMVHGDSDGTGAFALQHVPAGTFTLVATTTDGHTGRLPVKVADADEPGLVVKLEARAALVGRVVDANHAPVADVRVEVDAAGGALGANVMARAMSAKNAVTTADDGTFRAVGLDAGKVEVSVADGRGALAWADRDKPHEPMTFELVAGQDTPAGTLVVEATDGVIHGTVVGTDGKGVADAWITTQLDDSALDAKARVRSRMMGDFDGGRPVLTGADGKFVVDHLRRGTYDLVAEGPRGLSRADKHGVKSGDSVTLTLASLGTVSGHVTIGGGPVATFDVECKGPVSSSRHIAADDGSYSLERIAPGHYSCDATADGGTATGTVEVPAGPVTLDLAIVPWASVTGVVVSAVSGKPIAGLKIFAQGAGNQMAGMAAMLTGGGPMTDATGRFVVDKLGAGDGHLQILPPSGAFESLATRSLKLVAGQRLDLGVIKVVAPRDGDAGTLGMGTSVEGGSLVVSSVAAGGPAAAAGVAVGDKIVSIDGAPIADIGAELAKTALGSGTIGVGVTFALGLDRAGTPVQASVTSAKW